ncbi:hypothetical protein [Prosthecobacter sp.]|uniref:hypothetical protein n=1 Tax=Prosthecobacter sp. TaxID=1965333 RepID=UPI003784E18A
MKRTSTLHALLMAALLGLASVTHAAEETSDTANAYFHAFILCKTGMEAVEGGRREQAIQNLKSAQATIKEIQRTRPDWQPAIVAARLQKIENVLKSLGAR